MKARAFLRLAFFAFAAISVAGQITTPGQTIEDQALEEDFIRSRAELGESHASGARDDLGPVVIGNPTQAHTIIRVGLSYSFTSTGAFSEFATRHFPAAEISHTAGIVNLVDVATNTIIIDLDVPGTIVRTTRDAAGYHVSIGGVEVGIFQGPLHFRPNDDANLFRVENIRRTFGTTQVPSYRGMIELSHSTGTEANRLHVVNIIEIEDYVPGVVANESIASFHMEALKAQAVAARGYAIANIGRFRANFTYDIVDSTTSQVYRGVISEHPRAVQSSAETVGIVASYQGQIIGALYSSSFGGHSDSNHWIFNLPSNQLPGTNFVPYLVGIYDGVPPVPDLADPAILDTFWRTIQPQGYDMCGRVNNRFSRWRINIPAASIKSRLTTGNSVLISGNRTGPVIGVAVLQRMPGSGRVAVAQITLSTGVVEVRGWDNLRSVLGRSVVSTPSSCPPPNATAIAANFTLTNPSILEPYNNPDGTFGGVIAYGGGWGHNTGMSQYGGHGRALAGQTFLQILKAYYTGVDVGSYPIDIGREPGSGPPTLRQVFYAPNAAGSLVVRSDGLKKLIVHINETYDLVFDEAELAAGTLTVDISMYLMPGLNTIQYNPVGRTGSATVNVVIE
ncbi:MAG TPA: SpoIID/LytB domain-containing protein [Pyrinomonadaceae bacterium]